jgi:hypothetical protein
MLMLRLRDAELRRASADAARAVAVLTSVAKYSNEDRCTCGDECGQVRPSRCRSDGSMASHGGAEAGGGVRY